MTTPMNDELSDEDNRILAEIHLEDDGPEADPDDPIFADLKPVPPERRFFKD